MYIIQPVGIFFQICHRVHVRVIQMSGIQTQACDFIRDIAHNLFDLVGKFDIAARVRMDHRAHTPLVGALANRADIAYEACPFRIRQTRRGIRMAGGIVALIMACLLYTSRCV